MTHRDPDKTREIFQAAREGLLALHRRSDVDRLDASQVHELLAFAGIAIGHLSSVAEARYRQSYSQLRHQREQIGRDQQRLLDREAELDMRQEQLDG